MREKIYIVFLIFFSFFTLCAVEKEEQYYNWYSADKASGTKERNERLESLKKQLDTYYTNLWGHADFFRVEERGNDVVITKPLYDAQIAGWEKLIDDIKSFINELHPKLVARKTEEDLKNDVFMWWEKLLENINLLNKRDEVLTQNKQMSKTFYQDPLDTLDIFLRELAAKLPRIYKRINTSGYKFNKTTVRSRELAGYVTKIVEGTIKNLHDQIDTIKKEMTTIATRKKQEENIRDADATIRAARELHNPFLPPIVSLDVPMSYNVSTAIASVPKIAKEDIRSFKEIIKQYRSSDAWKSIKNNQFDLRIVLPFQSGYVFFDRKNGMRSIDRLIESSKDFDGKQKLTYKIHLQIKKQYVLKCMHILIEALNNDQRLANISTFKINDNLDTGRERQLPQIVLYIPQTVFIIPKNDLTVEQKQSKSKDGLLYLNPKEPDEKEIIGKIKTVQECNQELDTIVQALYEAFRGIDLKEWALGYSPRYNMQLTPIMYIAGGDADAKGVYPDLFTSDKHFVKGREYLPNNNLKILLDSSMRVV